MVRTTLRWLLALLYLAAGYFHLTSPLTFLAIMPGWVPYPLQVIYWTGLAEVAGAVALAQPFGPWLRKAAGIGLALYALCVWPANVNHMLIDLAQPDQGSDTGWGLAYHVPRMIAQPLLIWLALWTTRVTDWPFARRSG